MNCDALTYDIAFGTTPNPGVVASGLTVPGYDPGILLQGTTYYWQVIVHDGITEVYSPILSFTTGVFIQKYFIPFTIK